VPNGKILDGRPAWEWLLDDDERQLLDTLVNESVMENEWHSCNWCDESARWNKAIEHAKDCPLVIARVFAKALAVKHYSMFRRIVLEDK